MKTKKKSLAKWSEPTETASMRIMHSLFAEVQGHPHREELLTLMDEQLVDDTLVLLPQSI